MQAKYYTLNTGNKLPILGFGTYKLRKEDELVPAVDAALAAGYRLFDTASGYHNETQLCRAFELGLPKYGLTREDLFITSKLNPCDMLNARSVRDAYVRTVTNLDAQYLDLFVINYPGDPHTGPTLATHKGRRDVAWNVMIQLYDEGLVDSIGVCNFTVRQLRELIHLHHSVLPAVNQVEWHPYYHQDSLYRICHEDAIVLQGFSPLGGANANGELLSDPVVVGIAKKLKATPAQVLVAWSLHSDVPTLVKSKDPVRIHSNNKTDLKLTDSQMKMLNKLENGQKFAWDPSAVL